MEISLTFCPKTDSISDVAVFWADDYDLLYDQ
jgi:hypothetical protein